MMLPRIRRKRQRLSGGSYRGQQPRAETSRERRMRALVLGMCFIFLVLGVTERLRLTSETEVFDIDGVIAQDTFIAEIGFKSEDLARTREAREAAAANVPDVFHVDESIVAAQRNQLEDTTAAILAERPAAEKTIRDALAAAPPDQAPSTIVAKTARAFAEELIKRGGPFQSIENAEALATWLTPRVIVSTPGPAVDPGAADGAPPPEPAKPELRLEFVNSEPLARVAQKSLQEVLERGVLKPGERGSEFSKDPDRRITIQRDRGQTQSGDVPFADALTMDTAQEALRATIAKGLQEVSPAIQVSATDAPVDVVKLQDAAFAVAKPYLASSLEFDTEKTGIEREKARLAVEKILKEIAPSERIIGRGERWTPQTRSDAETYLEEKQRYDKLTANLVGALAGHAILVGLVLFALVQALPLLVTKREFTLRSLNLVLLVMCATIGVGRVVAYFDDTGLLVPVAAGAILLAILTNTRVSGLSSALIAILLSIQYDYSWRVLLVSAAMSFTGVLSIFMVRRRSDMGSAAVKATIVGVLTVLGMALAQDALFTEASFNALVSISLNGLVCVFVVPGLLSPLERLFGITTDIQLLEYSDLNNHILSRLAMEVPATYAHSLMLGQLAEAAADAIGANGLLARVCAYYHDIGKIRRPEYFSENQTGVNIHDDLSPRLSARAIASHVTEGAEMARELHLPKPLIDAIYEHHGTCLISFFYKEAVAQQKHGGVVESDFRYPGPRPRSRETAILMICDAVESGVRSLKNPNEERVREFIDRIITSRAEDRQFDECDLTLRDLDTIAEVLAKRISSSQHRRIAYPGQEKEPEPKVANMVPISGGQE